MTIRVLCTALDSWEGPHRELLSEAGFDCETMNQSLDPWNGDDLVRALQGCGAVIAGGEPYPAEVIHRCPQLRVIARNGVGFDAIDLAACDEQDIVVAIMPGVNHHSVAEHAIAMLVAVARGFPRQDRQVREGTWHRQSGPRIMGRTLGLVGLGRIGLAVAERALGLGMSVLAFDPLISPDLAKSSGVRLVGFSELLRESDFVSLHAPALPETYHLINDQSIAEMKPGAILINTARGQLVDESALIRGLHSGQLGGAGLDVFEQEPLPAGSPLATMENVLLSGHVAGLDDESHRDMCRMIVDTLIRLRAGEWPAERIVNHSETTGWSWSSNADRR